MQNSAELKKTLLNLEQEYENMKTYNMKIKYQDMVEEYKKKLPNPIFKIGYDKALENLHACEEQLNGFVPRLSLQEISSEIHNIRLKIIDLKAGVSDVNNHMSIFDKDGLYGYKRYISQQYGNNKLSVDQMMIIAEKEPKLRQTLKSFISWLQ